MKAFLIEGYNTNDYITNIIHFYPLKYTETLQQAILYAESLKNYNTKIILTDLPQDPKPNEHWDIII